MEIFGIDVGGSGIKGSVVDVSTGQLLQERFRIATPEPVNPERAMDIIQEILAKFNWNGPVGCGFPSIVKNGVARSAANIHPDWVGTDVKGILEARTGMSFTIVNDADAAGLAEMRFGEGRNHKGLVILLTIGTGIGSAVFLEGKLMPNTEFGHIEFRGDIAENYVSDRVRKADELSWKKWGTRLNKYLVYLERIFSPEVFLIGGGTSKYFGEIQHLITTQAPVVPAKLLNQAGIVGAALAAKESL